MTVPATTRRAGPFNGNDSSTSFPFTFRVFSKDDVQVQFANAAGVSSTLVLDSDYSVTVNADQDATPGGSITYPISGDPLASGEKLVILGAVPYEQTTDLPAGGAYRASVVEDALDRTVMQVQQLSEELGRALTLPAAAAGADTALPVPVADNFIGWNSTATALRNVDPSTAASIVAYATWRTDVFNGGAGSYILTSDPGSVHNCDVRVGGVPQTPGIDFTVSGTTLTPTTVWPAGTSNVVVRYGQALPQGTMDSSAVTHAAAGGPATTAQAKMRERFSFEDRGAVGDGSADDTTKVQAAIDAMAAVGGGVVHGTAGKTYRITAPLQLRHRVRIDLGTATVLQATDNTPIFKAPTTGDIQSWGLTNGRLRFNNQQTSAQTSAVGVLLADTKLAYDWYVTDLRVERACDGVACPNSAGSFAFVGRLVNVIGDSCARWAMNLDCDSGAGANTNIEIKNCWALQPSGAVISTSRGFRINALSQANIQSLFSDYIASGTLLSATNVDGYFGMLTLEATTLSVSSGAVALVEMSECSGTIESLKLVSNSLTTTGSGEIYMLRVATSGSQAVTVNNFVTQTNTYSGTGIYEVNPTAGAAVRVRRVKLDRAATLVDPDIHAPRIVEWDGRPRIGRGTTAQRPTLTADARGVDYLDTTLAAAGKPIKWNGTAWVDGLGAVV